MRQLFQSISQEQQAFDESSILINCAGITRDGWIGKKMDLVSQWQSVLDVNLTGTFLCCREFLNQDFLPNGGSIVNVSSVVALQGNLGQTNYAASKGGVARERSSTSPCSSKLRGSGIYQHKDGRVGPRSGSRAGAGEDCLG